MRSFIGNLRFPHKFLLIGLLATVMMAVPAALVLQAHMKVVTTAQREVSGLEPASAGLRLVRLLQQHRGLAAVVLSGDDSKLAARQGRQKDVDEALARSRAALEAFDEPALMTNLDSIAKDWQALVASLGGQTTTASESSRLHTALVTRTLELVDETAQKAGIHVHAQPAGYHLQVAVLRRLPQLTESMGLMRAQGSLLLAQGFASSEEKARFAALAGAMQQSLNGTRKALDQAKAADPALGQALAAPVTKAMTAADEGVRLVNERILSATELNFPADEYFAAATKVIDAQFELVDAAFSALENQLVQDMAKSRRSLAIVMGSLLALTIAALWTLRLVTVTTIGGVQEALRLANAVASGDLSHQVTAQSRDELGQLLQALNTMRANLANLVSTVQGNAESVATASAQIAQGNTDLSQRTEEQASALQQTAASMEQLSGTVRQNADNARQANDLSLSARGLATRGGDVVGEVVSTMQTIQDSSRRVTDIISVIEGIAFQTNILALNAAVEAARAGEHGRGFAVVASEVRALAQRSSEAAGEIKRLILTSAEGVEQGSTLVQEAGQAMSEIVDAIRRVSEIVGEISAASSEQSTGVAQVGQAVSQMDQTTQQNAALVEESAAAAESLRMQSSELVRLVSRFKLESHAG